jgi:two-component system cell cycle response regulator
MSRPLKLPTILLVSQNPTVRNWIKKHLDEDFFIIYAEKQYEATDALNSRLDFIILDSNIVDYNPLDLCQELSQISKKSFVPIFLITGKLKKSYRDQARASGVTDFLSDQLDIDELKTRILEGQKSALSREKTADLSLSIKVPNFNPSGGSLKNKLVLNDQGLRLLAEAKSNNLPVALLVMRIDQFEKLKDSDEVLGELAEFLQHILREKDVLIPFTDGKFILLLSDTTSDAARKIAERLREKIQLQPFAKTRGLTVSIAVSSIDASERGFKAMIDSAVKSFRAQSDTNLIISLDQDIL